MDDGERLTKLQEFLTEKYIEYVNKRKRKVGDNEFARWLGVSTGSYNQWINGNRLPGYDNVIRLADKLGPEIFDIMGYERVAVSSNPELIFVSENWRYLDGETRQQILEHIREEIQKRANRT